MASRTRGLTTVLALSIASVLGGCGSDDPAGPSSPDPQITTTDLAAGTVGEPYAEGVTATGGDGEYQWTVIDGVLPTGLALSIEDLPDGDDVLITGIPERDGIFTFDLLLTASDGRADTATLRIEILPIPGPLAIGNHRLPPGLVGYPYTPQMEPEGGTGEGERTFSIVSGSLPAGVSMDATGQFSGTPTTTGTWEVTIRITGGGESAQSTFDIRVHEERPDRFDITAVPVADVPPELEDNVEEALRRWEAALTGDLTRVDVPEGSFVDRSCGGFGGVADGTTIDDVVMLINIDSIDGPGGEDGNVLAQAGYCYFRVADEGEPIVGNRLPVLGVLTLDEWDLKQYDEVSEETVTDLIQHEMAHILGLGTTWDDFDLLENEGADDPRYLGQEAVAAYLAAGGDSTSIPVENEGGRGTADSHWRESVFDDELMTGFAEQPGNDMFLSEMTIASFADLGYEVDLSVADTAPLLAVRSPRVLATERHLGIDIIGVGTIRGITPDGETVSSYEPRTFR